MMMLAEAGTGVGKTLGYLAPASLWAEANGPGVWISTYTRALQRQIERESRSIWPDPGGAGAQGGGAQGAGELPLPSQLPGGGQCRAAGRRRPDRPGAHRALGPGHARRRHDRRRLSRLAADPVRRRRRRRRRAPPTWWIGAGSASTRVAPTIAPALSRRRSAPRRRADLVIANHALVLTQAAFDGARAARGGKGDGETTALRGSSSTRATTCSTRPTAPSPRRCPGQEAAEMRRWIRGPEGRGRRGRGLEARLMDGPGRARGRARRPCWTPCAPPRRCPARAGRAGSRRGPAR